MKLFCFRKNCKQKFYSFILILVSIRDITIYFQMWKASYGSLHGLGFLILSPEIVIHNYNNVNSIEIKLFRLEFFNKKIIIILNALELDEFQILSFKDWKICKSSILSYLNMIIRNCLRRPSRNQLCDHQTCKPLP